MCNRSNLLLEIGKIVGTHGLRGDVKVRLHSGDPEALLTADQVTLHLPSGERLTAEPVRQSLHKGQVLLRLQGLETINQVEHLVGGLVLLPQEQLPELAEDEYYWSQLKGLQVVDRERGPIGKLHQMFVTAAHDTYVVTGKYGEVLIPAVAQFILEIDLEKRIMQVDLPEGLIPEVE
ncbi:ribosome maturation factor RimM [Malonomonas rubra]|uniref:ribosome maturation factor RimM n=1 Tax=Malonomonas rubra TaxID=57040 RepID=UPI0026EADFA9|nr:ribosome maturation factor RimM [Malonomonas rubra]